MKVFSFYFFICITQALFSQIEFSSSSDINLFSGQINNFNIDQGKLRLNAPNAGKSQLIYSFESTNQLNFSTELGLEFSPSSNNKISIFIGEDSLSQNGIEISIGETGNSDALTYSELKDGQSTQVVRGMEGRFSEQFNSLLNIEINDSIIIKTSINSDSITEIKAPNNIKTICNYIVITCTYTSTRIDKFIFDNFELTTFPLLVTSNYPSTEYKKYDVWITEIMVDPSPARLLPETEYIELYNNTDSVINMENWEIAINDQKVVLPKISFNDYLILTNKSLEIDNELILSLPSINNEKSILELKDSNGNLIYTVEYDQKFKPSERDNGGYSYELQYMDTSSTILNWDYSNDFSGGTPGKTNSDTNNNHLKNRVFMIQGNQQVTWVKDFMINQYDTIINYVIEGDIDMSFNEVLYRPKDYGSEFLEFYNQGESGLTLDLWLGYQDELIKIPDSIYIPMNTFVLLTDNYFGLQKYYDVPLNCVIIILDNFPEILTEAEVRLYQNSTLLSETSYSNDQENDLTTNSLGVSLERIHENRWTSGNINTGGASPGAMNSSQNQENKIELITDEWVYHTSINQPIFVSAKNTDGTFILDVDLFSKNGKKLKSLYSSYHLSSDETLEINLENENLGFYVLLFEIKNEVGDIQKVKKTIVVAY